MAMAMMTRADPRALGTTEGRTRASVRALFAIDGFGFGIWAAHLPSFQSELALTDGALSIPLFAMVVGSLVAMPLAGRVGSRGGSRTVALASAGCFALSLPLLGFAAGLGWGLAPFVVAALAFGATKGALDVSANAQAIVAERDGSGPIVSSCHGCWSLGSLIGAGTAALALASSLPPAWTMLGAGLALGGGILAAKGGLQAGESAGPGATRPRSDRPNARLILLGLLAFFALFCEGAVGDWSAVYLAGPIGAGPAWAALGFAVYMTAMTGARFGGDRLVARFGPAALLRVGGLLVASGLGLALWSRTFGASLAGFGLAGLGLANAVPVLFRAAGRDRDAAGSIALVSTVGYLGFLAGPPAIGLLSGAFGLPAALLAVAAAGVAIWLGSPIARGEGVSDRPRPARPNTARAAGPEAALAS